MRKTFAGSHQSQKRHEYGVQKANSWNSRKNTRGEGSILFGHEIAICHNNLVDFHANQDYFLVTIPAIRKIISYPGEVLRYVVWNHDNSPANI